MFSQTERGQAALRALYAAHEQHFGATPEEEAVRLGYQVYLTDIDIYTGEVNYAGRVICLPRKSPAHVRRFIFGHCIGRVVLHRHDREWCETPATRGLARDNAREATYWCDGFATLQTFARSGVRLVTAETFAEFLTAGTATSTKGPDWQFHWKLGRFQGERIMELAKKHFAKGGPTQMELLSLGRLLKMRIDHIRQERAKR